MAVGQDGALAYGYGLGSGSPGVYPDGVAPQYWLTSGTFFTNSLM